MDTLIILGNERQRVASDFFTGVCYKTQSNKSSTSRSRSKTPSFKMLSWKHIGTLSRIPPPEHRQNQAVNHFSFRKSLANRYKSQRERVWLTGINLKGYGKCHVLKVGPLNTLEHSKCVFWLLYMIGS